MLSLLNSPVAIKELRLLLGVQGRRLERVDNGTALNEGDFTDSISLLNGFSSFSLRILRRDVNGEPELSECNGDTTVLSEFDDVVCVVAVESLEWC